MHSTTACTTCHNPPYAPSANNYTTVPTTCYGCHVRDFTGATTPVPHTGFATTCDSCHRNTDATWSQKSAFVHNAYFALAGAHATAPCSQCHNPPYAPSANNYLSVPTSPCSACHLRDYNNATTPVNHIAAGFPTTCDTCHKFSDATWMQGTFNHTYFPIASGRHDVPCAQCHTTPNVFTVFNCTICHTAAQTNPHHTGVSGLRVDVDGLLLLPPERASRLMRRHLAILAALVAWGAPAAAQSALDWGRVTLFGQVMRSKNDDGTTSDYNELTGSVTLHTPPRGADGVEFSIDARGSEYPSVANRDPRLTVYDAWVGGRIAGGQLAVRLGQMYLNDLGALGGVGGVALETRTGKFRFGLFGGLEPKGFDAGYVADVKKGGVYGAYDGERGWRDVLGFVTIRNQGLAERNVLSTTNFIPVGREFFLYQAAEYDLTGPGGVGSGGLAYFFATARWAPVRTFEIQGQYQHGRSIDARSITQDQLAGRPVDAKSLQGFLFDSMGGARDRRGRPRLAGLGRLLPGQEQPRRHHVEPLAVRPVLDERPPDGVRRVRVGQPDGPPGRSSYDAWYFSLGRSLGSAPLPDRRLLDVAVRPPADGFGRPHGREPALLEALQPLGNLQRFPRVLALPDGRAARRRHVDAKPGPSGPDVPFLIPSL